MDNNMKKSGQASMEFLMTYGWAILAAVLAIGALAYFGVFSPGSTLPKICTLNAPLGCDEHEVNSSGVRLIILNGAGASIDISNIDVPGCGSNNATRTITDGSTDDVFITCALSSGAKFNSNLVVTYTRSGKTIAETSTGNLRTEVK